MTRFDPDARPVKDAESGVNDQGTTITPIEAVIDARSTRRLHDDASLTEQILEERKKRAEPVHMAGLKPLPAGLRAVPGTGVIPGGEGALDLVPSVRRSIPPPFQRHRIAIDHHGKTWGYLRAEEVQRDDIVVDFGKVYALHAAISYEEVAGVEAATGVVIVLENVAGETRRFAPEDQLRVFRVHEETG